MGNSSYGTPPQAHDISHTLEPISAPLPKVASRPTTSIDSTRAPDVGQLLAPDGSPSLAGVDNTVLLSSITDAVKAIYQQIFFRSLDDLKPILERVPPPPETPFALEVMGFVVELVAGAATAELGGLAVLALTKTMGETVGAAVKEPLRSITRRAGSAASISSAVATTKARPEELTAHAAPGDSLLAEYLQRQRLALVHNQLAALDTLRVIQTTVAKIDPGQMQTLVTTIEGLAGDAQLSGWFRRKVAMEWLNFCARASLGPREPGQTTDVPGANQVGGIRYGHAPWPDHGAIDVLISAPADLHGIDGLRLKHATAQGNYGAAMVLKSAAEDCDAQHHTYNLATLPVYRNISISHGNGAYYQETLLMITPDGTIEANVDSDVLAAIGSGRSVGYGEAHENPVDHPMSAYATVLHARRASDAMLGARLLVDWLRDFKPEVLK